MATKIIREQRDPNICRLFVGTIFFNNHVRAQAPENTRRMVELFKEYGVSCESVRSSI